MTYCRLLRSEHERIQWTDAAMVCRMCAYHCLCTAAKVLCKSHQDTMMSHHIVLQTSFVPGLIGVRERWLPNIGTRRTHQCDISMIHGDMLMTAHLVNT